MRMALKAMRGMAPKMITDRSVKLPPNLLRHMGQRPRGSWR